MWNNPNVLTQYDAETDSLLLALHHSTPRQRLRTVKETVLDLSYCLRPDFPLWRSWNSPYRLPSPEELNQSQCRESVGGIIVANYQCVSFSENVPLELWMCLSLLVFNPRCELWLSCVSGILSLSICFNIRCI